MWQLDALQDAAPGAARRRNFSAEYTRTAFGFERPEVAAPNLFSAAFPATFHYCGVVVTVGVVKIFFKSFYHQMSDIL